MIEDDMIEGELKLNRRIPLAVVCMLLAQVGGILVWATQLDARVGDMERQSVSASGLNEKFARLEERLDNVKQDIAGIRQQLDHLTDKLLKP